MKSTIKLAVVLACALAPMRFATAETLRCGDALIQPGDDARYVMEKCGEPESGATLFDAESGHALPVYGIGIVRADRWLYHRKPGQFPAVLTIGDDGRVQNIEFEKARD